jgi:hypothetical protein
MSASQIRIAATEALWRALPGLTEIERHAVAREVLEAFTRLYGSQYVYVPATAEPFILETEEGRQLVMELRGRGHSTRAIAKVMGIGATAVRCCARTVMDGAQAVA